MAEEDHKSMKVDDVEEVDVDLDFDDDDDFGHPDELLISDGEDFVEVEELKSPWVSSWIDSETGKTVHGVEMVSMKDDYVMYRDFYGSKKIDNTEAASDDDVCSICYRRWDGDGNHQICCLPCGHIFGMSCIKKWLEIGPSKKCPQCNTLCEWKNVRPLYATCISDDENDDENAPHRSPVDQKAPTRRFPFNMNGVFAVKIFEFRRRNFALNKKSVVLKRLGVVKRHRVDALKRKSELLRRKACVLKRAKVFEERANSSRQVYALRQRANAIDSHAGAYTWLAKELNWRVKVMVQQVEAYRRRAKAYQERRSFYSQSYDQFVRSPFK